MRMEYIRCEFFFEALDSRIVRASAGWRKFPDYFKGKEIRFFQKIGFLDGLKISALQH
jgi:hypothetical protein